jgi:hypothetical protein
MHKEMVRARLRSEEPDIAFRLERVLSGFYDLVVENVSSNAIFDLKFSEFPNAEMLGLEKNSELGLFKRGLTYMAPGQKYRTFFLNYPIVVQGNQQPPSIKFAFSFRDKSQRSFSKTVEINLDALYNTILFGDGVELHDHFRKLNEILTELLKKNHNLHKSV